MGQNQPKASVSTDQVLGAVAPELAQVNAQLERARTAKWNVIAPDEIREVPRHFRVLLNAIRISSDIARGEVYKSKTSDDFLLRKAGLEKLGRALGVDWQPSMRLDDGKNPMVAMVQAHGRVLGWDGRWQDITQTYQLDVMARDEENRAVKRKNNPRVSDEQIENMVRQERIELLKHKVSRAETGAKERVVAALIGKRAFSAAELAQPFLCAQLVVDVSESPDGQNMLLMAAMKIAPQLYGSARPAARELPAGPPDPEPPPALEAPAPAPIVTGTLTQEDARVLHAPPAEPAGPPMIQPEGEDDFTALDLEEQQRSLRELVRRKGYQMPAHPKTGELVTIESLSPKNRKMLFERLRALSDAPSEPDDIPF